VAHQGLGEFEHTIVSSAKVGECRILKAAAATVQQVFFIAQFIFLMTRLAGVDNTRTQPSFSNTEQ
jgi:hypothetical protein